MYLIGLDELKIVVVEIIELKSLHLNEQPFLDPL